jgi:hypothetical protein
VIAVVVADASGAQTSPPAAAGRQIGANRDRRCTRVTLSSTLVVRRTNAAPHDRL